MAETERTTLQVMVADDEPKVRALVAGCARSIGADVVEASDGDEAWALAQSHRLDLVVLDVMMPGMSGWEVCRRIKGSAKTARGLAPKVLMLTGIGEHLNEMTSPLFAADDWIDKPFDLDDLRTKMGDLGRTSLGEAAAEPAPTQDGPTLRKARPSSEQLGDHDDGSDAAFAGVVETGAEQPAATKPSPATIAEPEAAPAAAPPPPVAAPAPAKVAPAKAAPVKPAPVKAAKKTAVATVASSESLAAKPAAKKVVKKAAAKKATKKAAAKKATKKKVVKKAAAKKATKKVVKKAAAKKATKKVVKKAAAKKATKKKVVKKAAAKKATKKVVKKVVKKAAPKKKATKKKATKKRVARGK